MLELSEGLLILVVMIESEELRMTETAKHSLAQQMCEPSLHP